jgi:hypothetical protein
MGMRKIRYVILLFFHYPDTSLGMSGRNVFVFSLFFRCQHKYCIRISFVFSLRFNANSNYNYIYYEELYL